MPREDQIIFEKEQLIAYNKPTLDGTHWNKSWDFIRDHNEFSLDELQGLALDATMAWRGRLQIYTSVWGFSPVNVLKIVLTDLRLC